MKIIKRLNLIEKCTIDMQKTQEITINGKKINEMSSEELDKDIVKRLNQALDVEFIKKIKALSIEDLHSHLLQYLSTGYFPPLD